MGRSVYAVIIKEKKKKILLLGEDRLTLPGGEPREGETDRETLERKFKEYGAKIRKIKEYKTFKEGGLEAVVYFIKLRRFNLIENSVLIGYEDTSRLRFSYPTNEVIKDLFKEGHLNAC